MPSQPLSPVVIDDAFIRDWHPKYDLTESDEGEYQRLIAQVFVRADDIDSTGVE